MDVHCVFFFVFVFFFFFFFFVCLFFFSFIVSSFFHYNIVDFCLNCTSTYGWFLFVAILAVMLFSDLLWYFTRKSR